MAPQKFKQKIHSLLLLRPESTTFSKAYRPTAISLGGSPVSVTGPLGSECSGPTKPKRPIPSAPFAQTSCAHAPLSTGFLWSHEDNAQPGGGKVCVLVCKGWVGFPTKRGDMILGGSIYTLPETNSIAHENLIFPEILVNTIKNGGCSS